MLDMSVEEQIRPCWILPDTQIHEYRILLLTRQHLWVWAVIGLRYNKTGDLGKARFIEDNNWV